MNWPTGFGKKQAQEAASNEPKMPRQKLALHWLGRLSLALFILVSTSLAALSGMLFWACQSESGQAWLLKTANAALESSAGELGLRLTRISGSLPFDFSFALEGRDKQGIWLEAPENRLVLGLCALPLSVRVEKLSLTHLRLTRLPELPPAPDEQKTARPLDLAEVQGILGKLAQLFQDPPFWLPELFLAVRLEDASFAAALLGKDETEDYNAASPESADAPASPPVPAASLLGNASLELSLDAKNGFQLKANSQLASAGAEEARLSALGFREADLMLSCSIQAGANGLDAAVQTQGALASPRLAVKGLPPQLLGHMATFSLKLDAANLGSYESQPRLSLTGPRLDAGGISLEGSGVWQAGSGWKESKLDGTLDLKLAAGLAPPGLATTTQASAASNDDVLSILRAPLRLTFAADGELASPNLELRLDCAELVQDSIRIQNLALALAGKDIALPLNSAFPPAGETAIDLDLTASLNGQKLATHGQFFYASASESAPDTRAIRAGLRQLKIDLAGIAGTGDFSAILPPLGKPQLNGALHLDVADWNAISALAPGLKFNGDAKLELELKAQNPQQDNLETARSVSQAASLVLRVPRLSAKENSGKEVASLQGLDGAVKLTDLFGTAQLEGHINLREARAAAMRLGAKLTANGSLPGPLNAKLASTGDVVSRLDLTWQPGSLLLHTLQAQARLSATSAGGKPTQLGLKLVRAANLHYGPDGIGADRLELALTPSGRIRLNGALAPDKLNLELSLANLALKPWQALVPDLPAGMVELAASLKGSPAKPAGRFRLGLSDLHISGSPLPPLALALAGEIESAGKGSSLNARLELSPASLKALGGEKAKLAARIPLLFGEDGIPRPNMRGQLSAQAQWDGALGPLWSLVPTADRRLNGRIRLNANAQGTLAQPRIKGGIEASQGRFEDLQYGILLTDIALKLELADQDASKEAGLPGKARISLSASDGRGGKASLNGSAALNGNDLNLKASLERLRPLRRRDVQIMLSGKAAVAGSATAPEISGEIIVNQGEVLLNNMDLSASITTLPIRAATPASAQKTAAGAIPRPAAASLAQTATTPKGKLHVRIIVLPRFTVEGRGLTSLWKADLLLAGTLEDPQIIGSIDAVRGNFDFLGKNFTLTRGAVTFAGGALSDPLLNLEFTNERPDLAAHIGITGTVHKMKLALTSEPALPRDDILSRVLFGKSVNELGRLEALQLAGAVAQLAGMGSGGGGVFGTAKKALGVDVLRLGSSSSGGEPGTDSADGANLEMGKYLTDNIYMGVAQGMKPDSTAFIIQLELTPRTSLEVRTEQQNTWGGIKWNYKY